MQKVKFGKFKTKYEGKIFTIKEAQANFSNGKKEIFEFCARQPSVSILAFNNKKELLLIREYRHGHDRDVWFLPAGRMDIPGETPRQTALRELREETGYRAKKIRKISESFPSNTMIWDVYFYLATDLIFDPMKESEHTDNLEDIVEVKFVPFKKAVQMALDGSIENEFLSYNIIRLDYKIKKGEIEI